MKFITVIVNSGLQSSDILHVRNVLNMLQRIKSVYPGQTGFGELIYPFLEPLAIVIFSSYDYL